MRLADVYQEAGVVGIPPSQLHSDGRSRASAATPSGLVRLSASGSPGAATAPAGLSPANTWSEQRTLSPERWPKGARLTSPSRR